MLLNLSYFCFPVAWLLFCLEMSNSLQLLLSTVYHKGEILILKQEYYSAEWVAEYSFTSKYHANFFYTLDHLRKQGIIP